MRRNPLLYSDQSEIDGPIAHHEEPPKQKRSLFFFFIILANSLLVLFVLGIIWFLFLKSPDLHIKELTEKFFGTPTTQSLTETKVPPTPTATMNSNTNVSNVTPAPTRQEQEEIQQTRLKQMRAQEDLAIERQRLEKINIKLEADKIKSEKVKQALEVKTATLKSAEVLKPEDEPKALALQAPVETDKQIESTSSQQIEPSEVTSQQETVVDNKEPAVIPNAASESLIPQGKTTGSQIDIIMEQMKQQEKEKTIKQPLNDSRAPATTKHSENLVTKSKPIINHLLIEKQLDALIETETLKSQAGKLLKQANDLDEKIRINQKLSILQANAV